MEEDVYESSSILPRRVNEPPAIFSGCTFKESVSIAVGSFAFWILMAIIVGLLTGLVMVLLGGSIFLTIISTYLLAGKLRSIKQGKPVGYHAQKYRLFLERWGMGVSHLYQGKGRLETGRSRQYISRRRLIRHDVDEQSVDERLQSSQ